MQNYERIGKKAMKQEIMYCDPLDLVPYENNPRINDYAVKKVLKSLVFKTLFWWIRTKLLLQDIQGERQVC